MKTALSLLALLAACDNAAPPSGQTLAPAVAADRLACQATLRIWEQGAEGGDPVSAEDLNRGGALCLASGDPATALVLLAAAVDHEPTHALAHLNRARAISVLQEAQDPQTACDLGATPARLVAHLRAVQRLAPERLAEATDLSVEARSLPPVRLLLSEETDLRKRTVLAVQGARFSTQEPGSSVPLAVVLSGEAPHTDLDHALPAALHRGTAPPQAGGWAVDEQGQVLLDPDGAGAEPVQALVLTEQGALQDPATGQLWDGIPDPCAS